MFVSIFDLLCVVGEARLACCDPETHCFMSAVDVPFGSGCVGPKAELRTMKTNLGLVEKNDESVFDASSEDELLGEQNQWCPLLELCFHCTVGCVLVKALGVDIPMRVSVTCMFAILNTPVNRESQDKFLW